MKSYLVVGGSSGIGKQIAEMLYMEGHRVFATYCRNKKESKDRLSYHYLDVTSDEVDFAFLPARLDGVVYCPGSLRLRPFNRTALADYEADYRLQVVGALKVLQHVVPLMKENGRGSVVLFSSVAAGRGFPFHASVAACKGAIEGLTKALAAELAPVIRVNCVAPSLTNTPLTAGLLNSEEKLRQHSGRHPLQRVGEALDIAAAAMFLLGDHAGWITAQTMHVDGGLSAIALP